MISDPCYVSDFAPQPDGMDYDFAKPDDDDNYPYSYVGSCGATISEAKGGQLGRCQGVVSSTGWGDGVYDVYQNIDIESGRVASLEIIFMRESDNDDYADDDDDDDEVA